MNRQDWTLLAIAAAAGEPMSPVQLQKSLFLIGQKLSQEQLRTRSFYEFRPYDYGPFDRQVYTDAEILRYHALVAIEHPPHRSYRVYRATPDGLEAAKQLESQLSAPVVQFLRDLVQWVRGLSFSALVSKVYDEYPDMRVNSVFQG